MTGLKRAKCSCTVHKLGGSTRVVLSLWSSHATTLLWWCKMHCLSSFLTKARRHHERQRNRIPCLVLTFFCDRPKLEANLRRISRECDFRPAAAAAQLLHNPAGFVRCWIWCDGGLDTQIARSRRSFSVFANNQDPVTSWAICYFTCAGRKWKPILQRLLQWRCQCCPSVPGRDQWWTGSRTLWHVTWGKERVKVAFITPLWHRGGRQSQRTRKKRRIDFAPTWSWGCSAWRTAGTWGSWCWAGGSGRRCPTAPKNPRRSSARLRKSPGQQGSKMHLMWAQDIPSCKGDLRAAAGQSDLAGVVVLRIKKVAELRQQLGPRLQLPFGGDGRDQDALKK